MLTNFQSICTRALKLATVVGAGETPDSDDLSDAFATAKEMINGWALDRLTVLVVERAVFPLTSGQQSYTIGAGGDFDRQRPVWLNEASVLLNTNASQPIELPIEVLIYQQWQQQAVKNVTSGLITQIYYDHGYDADGLGTIYVWPLPSIASLSLVLYCPTTLNEPTSLTAQYNFAPGYIRAIRYNLALELSAEYGLTPLAHIPQKAAEYLGDVRRANIQPVFVSVDPALTSRSDYFNYYTGNSRR